MVLFWETARKLFIKPYPYATISMIKESVPKHIVKIFMYSAQTSEGAGQS